METTRKPIRIRGREYDKNLFIARCFYLSYFASYGSLFPLLAIYFKQLGMSAAQAGLLTGCRPFVEIISRPFWSSFAGRFKKVFALCSSLFFFFCFFSFFCLLSIHSSISVKGSTLPTWPLNAIITTEDYRATYDSLFSTFKLKNIQQHSICRPKYQVY